MSVQPFCGLCPLSSFVMRKNQWWKEKGVFFNENSNHVRVTSLFSHAFFFFTLWLSIRLRTRSMSPWTGWSSASCGSTLYSQSVRAWRASVNCPENSSASSSLFCLQEKTNSQWRGLPESKLNLILVWTNGDIHTFPLTSHRQCPICLSARSAYRPVSEYRPGAMSCLSGRVLFAWWYRTLSVCFPELFGTPALEGQMV